MSALACTREVVREAPTEVVVEKVVTETVVVEKFGTVDSIETVDDHTVKFNLRQPSAWQFGAFALPAPTIYAKNTLGCDRDSAGLPRRQQRGRSGGAKAPGGSGISERRGVPTA